MHIYSRCRRRMKDQTKVQYLTLNCNMYQYGTKHYLKHDISLSNLIKNQTSVIISCDCLLVNTHPSS